MYIKRLNIMGGYKSILAVTAILALTACSSGSSDDPATDAADSTPIDLSTGAPMDMPPVIDPTTQLELNPEDAQLLDALEFEQLGGEGDTPIAEDNGNFQPRVFPTETTVDLAYAQAGAALIEQLNESIALPQDIDVDFADCGTANAFFAVPDDASVQSGLVSAGGAIIMCHELTELFGQFFGDTDQAFAASVFVLMHEVGHALVDQLDLPVLGIEESYVDGIAAVVVGESGLSESAVFAGWFFGSQGQTPFFDSHRAGPQRLGDLACWGVGADPTLLEDPNIANIFAQLVLGGRNCEAEYEQQRAALEFVLGPNIRGGLAKLNPVALPPEATDF